MEQIRFDFNNMFSFSVGKSHGVSLEELNRLFAQVKNAHAHLHRIIRDKRNRITLGLEWVKLPFQEDAFIKKIQHLGKEIAYNYENVIFLGIGGSYLGLKAAQDALAGFYYNEFSSLRQNRPKIYFEGNNLDPDTLSPLLKNLDAKKTFVIVISKSGETTETKAAFCAVEDWLKKEVGRYWGRQVFVITDLEKGKLRQRVILEQKKDNLSFRNLPVLEGVGGRFSELNIGLLHLAILGISLQEILAGARAMHRRCTAANLWKNPAYLYAVLQFLLYKKKGKDIAIIMPFSERLKSTADWYVQLLAESLGKKYARQIKVLPDGLEAWQIDKTKILNVGRTPISCRGTNDLHSIQQNIVEGENNKSTTFIKIKKFNFEIVLPADKDFLCARKYSQLMSLAQEATEWALVRAGRPNCTIILPKINAFYWGGLLYFFQMATAFEGELLNVNAFDQPGVESYKAYMYYKLKKPGFSKEVAEEIKRYPLKKKNIFIL